MPCLAGHAHVHELLGRARVTPFALSSCTTEVAPSSWSLTGFRERCLHAQDTPTLFTRVPADLAREFEPSARAIRNWVVQADRWEDGRGAVQPAALTATERDELARLRRGNKQLRVPLCQ